MTKLIVTGLLATISDPRGYAIVADSFENTQLPNNYTNDPIILPNDEKVRIFESRVNEHNEVWYRVKHFNPRLSAPEFIWVWEPCLAIKE